MRSKGHFIEETGGFRIDESPAQFKARVALIRALTTKIKSGKFTEDDLEHLRELKGLPPDEWTLNHLEIVSLAHGHSGVSPVFACGFPVLMYLICPR
jgi:hypothetical protein